jgi:hypothetical protein
MPDVEEVLRAASIDKRAKQKLINSLMGVE